MSKLDHLIAATQLDIESFNNVLNKTLSNKKTIATEAVNHLLSSQGKLVRPMLMILAAKLNGQITEKTYLASCLIELTHAASLIHDDIVDEAYMRRGMLSTYAIWRNKNSVLIGDYIFSRAINIACQNGLYDILQRISLVIENMSIGELEQSDAAMKLDITEEKYYEIINGKTAELISACAYAGALTAGADKENCEKMTEFGKILGYIFQIKDDMLDYSTRSNTGKKTCNDIREQKITLPLIAALSKTNKITRKEILNHISKANKNESSVQKVFDFVLNSSGMEYCNNKLLKLREKAIEILDSYNESEEKNLLIELMDYFIERNK